MERVVELARANASDAWAERRGYTARSLEALVAETYDAAGLAGFDAGGRSAEEVAWSMRGTHPLHLVYESIGEAALALQDFLFANQNRLAKGRLLGGITATRPLPVWRLEGDTVDRGSSRLVDVDIDLGETLCLGHGPVPL
jgi:hypothetical protein